MAQRRNRTEQNDKEEAPAASTDVAASASPMYKFRSLARKIVGVPRQEYEEAEEQYRKSKTTKP
jgi:hypothetical protein